MRVSGRKFGENDIAVASQSFREWRYLLEYMRPFVQQTSGTTAVRMGKDKGANSVQNA